MGSHLEIVKQVGSPANLEQTCGVSQLGGTHGIGHTRVPSNAVPKSRVVMYTHSLVVAENLDQLILYWV
jgi:glutamate synthase domain-containing protein 1